MNKIVNSIVDLIKDNKNILNQIYNKDKEVFDIHFDINKLIDVILKYKNEIRKHPSQKRVFVNHYGSPYVTAMICLDAIVNNVSVCIGIEQICYGLNKAVVKIINDILKEQKEKLFISLEMDVTNSELVSQNFDEIIFLGNSNEYNRFRKLENVKVRFIPFCNLAVYYDSIDYEELSEDIRNYAYKNLYEIEIFDETEEIEDVIYIINNSEPKYSAVILSKDKEKQERFKQEVNCEKIYVNKNPFKDFNDLILNIL